MCIRDSLIGIFSHAILLKRFPSVFPFLKEQMCIRDRRYDSRASGDLLCSHRQGGVANVMKAELYK